MAVPMHLSWFFGKSPLYVGFLKYKKIGSHMKYFLTYPYYQVLSYLMILLFNVRKCK